MKQFHFAKRKLQLVRAAITVLTLAISIPLSAQTITTFDAPGAGTGPLQGTYALDIEPSGTTIGFIRDANEVRHGFIRSHDGSFTILDAPGALQNGPQTLLFGSTLRIQFPPSRSTSTQMRSQQSAPRSALQAILFDISSALTLSNFFVF